jgi:D-alanyl-D-alanine carboxypeptidase
MAGLIAAVSPASAGVRGELWHHLRYHDSSRLVDAARAYPPASPPPKTISCRINPEMVPALSALLAAASTAGHALVAASCFRSVDQQVDVFFAPAGGAFVDSPQAIASRAEQIAPPGFSEHHTGLSIDFCDGATPATCQDFNPRFAETETGKWLQANGSDYGFEMSFPRPSDPCVAASGRAPQGVAYEPWHWRFVGAAAPAQVFDRARTLFALCPRPGLEFKPPDRISSALGTARRTAAQLWTSFVEAVKQALE